MPLQSVSIVLVGTTHDGNVGAAARVMGNMGLERLKLVRPRSRPGPEAFARAAGAARVLERAVLHDDLAAALADCNLVLGATARRRAARRPTFDPRAAVDRTLAHCRRPRCRAAFVFGRESSGLTNAELDLCDGVVSIPVDPGCPSLNLAAAVAVICYELRCGYLAGEPPPRAAPEATRTPATSIERESFLAHLEALLRDLDFIKSPNPQKLLRKIRGLCLRADPDSGELNLLRGIMTAIQERLPRRAQ